jgi:hypothetical protein
MADREYGVLYCIALNCIVLYMNLQSRRTLSCRAAECLRVKPSCEAEGLDE